MSTSAEPEHLALFSEERRAPRVALLIEEKEAYMHCAKALMRSRLWADESRAERSERSELPTLGEMMADPSGSGGPIESQAERGSALRGGPVAAL